eukprot:4692118-Pyramimonas_sp.AAC.1
MYRGRDPAAGSVPAACSRGSSRHRRGLDHARPSTSRCRWPTEVKQPHLQPTQEGGVAATHEGPSPEAPGRAW